MSNIKPIQINPELFKISSHSVKNKTIKNRNNAIKPNVLKKDLLARIKSYRNRQTQLNNSQENSEFKENLAIEKSEPIENIEENKQESLEMPITVENNNSTVIKKTCINNDDDFLESIDFLKSLSKQKTSKNNSFSSKFPLEKQSDGPGYGCLKNGSLPTFRNFHNTTIKKTTNTTNILDNNKSLPYSEHSNKKTVTFKYNLGKKHKVVSVLIKNRETRKKISDEHNRLKESKINDMKNYLKRHNLLKSGSKCPPDVIKKIYEQALLSGDIRNTNKNSVIHNYLAE